MYTVDNIPLKAKNVLILDVRLLKLYQSRADLIRLLKDIFLKRDGHAGL